MIFQATSEEEAKSWIATFTAIADNAAWAARHPNALGPPNVVDLVDQVNEAKARREGGVRGESNSGGAGGEIPDPIPTAYKTTMIHRPEALIMIAPSATVVLWALEAAARAVQAGVPVCVSRVSTALDQAPASLRNGATDAAMLRLRAIVEQAGSWNMGGGAGMWAVPVWGGTQHSIKSTPGRGGGFSLAW